MTGEQARAARELLGWSRMRLGVRAGIPESAIASFEQTGLMQVSMHKSTSRIDALRATLEAAGVIFSAGPGPSVKLQDRPGNADWVGKTTGGRPAKLAAPGSLQPGVLADLVALRNFLDGRDRALESLIGRKLARSHLRDELIRMVVIEFGFGRLQPIAFYQTECVHLGDGSSVQSEINLLADCGLILFRLEESSPTASLIGPSQGLVAWYSSQLPRLMDEVQQFVAARAISR